MTAHYRYNEQSGKWIVALTSQGDHDAARECFGNDYDTQRFNLDEDTARKWVNKIKSKRKQMRKRR